jgi:hypothetical protein
MLKIVLISENGYNPEHDSLLMSFLDQKIQLFCAVGKDCELWEEIMDELAVGNGEQSRYITTTSHPNESVEDVIEFAKMFNSHSTNEVQVVRI